MVWKNTQFCSDWVFLWEKQWRNRQGSECPPPETSDWEISADLQGKKRQGKKENRKREGGKLKMERGKVTKWGENIFFSFSLFTTTEICFGSTKIGNFLPGKIISHREKKSGKMTLPPLKNIPLTPLERSVGKSIKISYFRVLLKNNYFPTNRLQFFINFTNYFFSFI